MSNLSTLSYANLKVSPFELIQLQELTLTRKFNNHAYVTFTGMISEEKKDTYVQMCEAGTAIEISQIDEDGGSSPLFCGIIRTISVRVVRDIYYLEVDGVSHSQILDIEKKSRSFQNRNMTYPELLKAISADYPNIDIMDEATDGLKIGKFMLQYEETDWEFLKRIASQLRTGLMPAMMFDTPKFYFGLNDSTSKGKLQDYNYRMSKHMDPYRYTSENTTSSVTENDYIYYEVETVLVLELGNHIGFKGKLLYVCEAYTELKGGILLHRYVLSSREGLRQITFYNEQLIGASLQGEVIDVSKDTVKVHLSIDKSQNASEAYSFPYSSMYTAEGNSGWYCMPEKGDHVRIYFPSHLEEEGIASSSVRQNSEDGETNKLGNPNIKYFRTASGKELMMSPDEIVITGKDGEIFIRLSEKDGIEIASSQHIKLVAKEDIEMKSDKKIIMSAQNEISLSCKDSSIEMNGNTTIVGLKLKTN